MHKAPTFEQNERGEVIGRVLSQILFKRDLFQNS